MKGLFLILITTVLLFVTFSHGKAQKLHNQADSMAYAIGLSVAEKIAKNGIKLKPKLIYKGYRAAIKGTLRVTKRDYKQKMQVLRDELDKRGQKSFSDKDQPKTNLDTIAIVLGFNIASNLQKAGLNLNGKLIAKGYRDGTDAKENRLDAATAQHLIAAMRELEAEGLAEQKRIDIVENKKEAEVFLAKNKLKEGVVELQSGLQYKIEREGSGEPPTASDRVVVHFKGYLINGDVFENSYEHDKPSEFSLNALIGGLTEGLQYMKPGAKFIFYIPSKLAYRERGLSPYIGPNVLLIFEVELLEVKKE